MRYARKHRGPFGRDARGAAILEMAVILPVLLTIGLGVFEFGNLIYRYHLITVGVRDGARYIAGLPQADDSGNSLVAGNETAAKNIAIYGTTGTSTPRVSWWNDPTTMIAINYTNVPNDNGSGVKLYRGGANIVLVTMSTNVEYQPLGFLGFLGLGTITLHAQHEERLFGVR